MTARANVFRDIVTDAVAERIAKESRAGYPQGLTNRTFESITGALIMTDWEKASETKIISHFINELCGLIKVKRLTRKKGY